MSLMANFHIPISLRMGDAATVVLGEQQGCQQAAQRCMLAIHPTTPDCLSLHVAAGTVPGTQMAVQGV